MPHELSVPAHSRRAIVSRSESPETSAMQVISALRLAEADPIVAAYKALTAGQKNKLIAFLNSL